MKLTDFISTYLPYAERASKIYKVPSEYILAIAAIESFTGNSLSKLAEKYNNFGGIKYNPNIDRGYAELKTLEWLQGKYVSLYQKFASYASPSEGFDAIGRIVKKHYQGQSIPEKQRNLFSKYATDPNYIAKVKNVQRLIQNQKRGQSIVSKATLWPLMVALMTLSIVYLEKKHN
jgi:flagellum-specific peptidoglycan hydrolase FlgJ